MKTVIAASLLLIGVSLHAADVPPPSGDSIVASDARLELLYTRTAPIHRPPSGASASARS